LLSEPRLDIRRGNIFPLPPFLTMVNYEDHIAALEEMINVLQPVASTVPDLRTSLVQRLDDLDRRM